MLAKKQRRVTSEKVAVSFRRGTLAKAKKFAKRYAAGNVSAYVEEAVAARMRRDAGAEAVAYYESKNGVITEEDLAAVRLKWPKD